VFPSLQSYRFCNVPLTAMFFPWKSFLLLCSPYVYYVPTIYSVYFSAVFCFLNVFLFACFQCSAFKMLFYMQCSPLCIVILIAIFQSASVYYLPCVTYTSYLLLMPCLLQYMPVSYLSFLLLPCLLHALSDSCLVSLLPCLLLILSL
jgi:hypothetical protein